MVGEHPVNLDAVKFDAQGLVAAIAQDRLTGEIRMMAWMNAEALRETQRTGLATFYSRSRQKLWVKGESSGHTLRVAKIVADCDADTLLLLCDPAGPSCHTGRDNCFFDAVGEELEPRPALPELFELERTIQERQASTGEKSYTKHLLDAGPTKINAKINEEAGELAQAIAGESDERVASEAADVLYHVLVGLRVRGVSLRRVLDVLAARSGRSGHEEKAARKT
jgi:phosphoribosyl-ATP pyrophosphohydrolase/phosphoribosyl-AMP cyclohydrolase